MSNEHLIKEVEAVLGFSLREVLPEGSWRVFPDADGRAQVAWTREAVEALGVMFGQTPEGAALIERDLAVIDETQAAADAGLIGPGWGPPGYDPG